MTVLSQVRFTRLVQVLCSGCSVGLGRRVEALDHARAAPRLDQRALGAQYVVGSFLVLGPDTIREGAHHLELTAEKSPSAAQPLAEFRQTLAGMQ